MREIRKASKAILNERGQPLSAWITVLLVQWALNTAVRQRFRTSPGREPRTSFAPFVEEKEELELSELHEQKLREHVQGMIGAQE